jgi:hypothetical protein
MSSGMGRAGMERPAVAAGSVRRAAAVRTLPLPFRHGGIIHLLISFNSFTIYLISPDRQDELI